MIEAIQANDLIFTAASYHRNGCAGEGFHRVEMRTQDEDGWRTLHAVVFDTAAHVAVIDDLGRSWRCEDFEPALRAFLDSSAAVRMIWPDQAGRIPANEA